MASSQAFFSLSVSTSAVEGGLRAWAAADLEDLSFYCKLSILTRRRAAIRSDVPWWLRT
jgi:hypothetical protein